MLSVVDLGDESAIGRELGTEREHYGVEAERNPNGSKEGLFQ